MHQTPKDIETTISKISITFYFVVIAQDFKWKTAGNVNATGVHVTDPKIDKNDEVF